ncbi:MULTISPECIES: AAA family ATPase [unclassified Polynucleobacter]|uniref:AAA family ATPase n=1 Tax=unclassified Polynucleobacter TaxID=2640945 RepID=UPI002572A848|nr:MULTISPECIES: AAA family ATPase [unclassified Polynucleobacter]BEI43322.1 hypothetical protein PHIN10_14710 [Polynucleobacter sp. HIN10]BEI45098.1 hypothetical protein PHIN11_14700 [Polynucleobacter sp. HIN11]
MNKQVVVIAPNLEKIPALLKQKSNWLCWKRAELKPNGRYGKLPTNVHGRVINAHDTKHHVLIESAFDSYLSDKASLDGIALDLPVDPQIYGHTDDGQPLYLIGGDIDECITYEGNKPVMSDQARSDLKALGTPYWELSPSGTGIRWFGLHTKPLKGGNKNGREMYSSGRFLTVTGKSKGGEIKILPPNIELLEREWFGSTKINNTNADLLAHPSTSYYQLPEKINDGEGRNSGLLRYAGHLRAKGLSQEEIELSCIGFNQVKINPPLPIEKVLDIARRYENQTAFPHETFHKDASKVKESGFALNLDTGLIKLVASSPKRPFIAGDDIIPLGTYSALAGWGGVGKTNAVISLATQASIGGVFAGRDCKETCVLMLACEDSEAEINARFCAAIENLPKERHEDALKNIRVFSLVGQDIQMVRMSGRNAVPTGKSETLINAIHTLKQQTGIDRCLVIIDHARMIASVDWNDSAQATVFTREMQHIASETGAGLVVLTHTNKNSMKADHAASQGDISGSTAIVDNARWVALVHGMNDADAKSLGIGMEMRQNYVSMEIVKSNYCAIGRIGWFIKRTINHHSTSTIEHIELVKPILTKPGDNALEKRLIDFITSHSGLTINKIKGFSGTKGVLRASEKAVVSAIQELIDKGMVKLETPSDEQLKTLGLPKNTSGILLVPEGVK